MPNCPLIRAKAGRWCDNFAQFINRNRLGCANIWAAIDSRPSGNWRSGMQYYLGFVLSGAILLLAAGSSAAQGRAQAAEAGFWAATALRGLSFDGLNSQIVRQAARDSFELSGGQLVDLAKWYSPKFPNLSASFQTQINRDVALIWGGSIGEAGTKYRLGPSGVIGLAMQRRVGKFAMLRIDVAGQFGGALQERPCVGDYGAIGGVQQVNCRLAASPLPPKQTLQYQWDEPAAALGFIQITYQVKF